MIRNLLITLGLSLTLVTLALFVFMPPSGAQTAGILPQLIDLPAPPPPNPLVRNIYAENPPEFFSQDNPPPDDAPIEDLLAYWIRQNTPNDPMTRNITPSDRVLERLLEEIEKTPGLLNSYLNVLARKPESADVVKRMYDRLLSDENTEKYRIEGLKRWLTYNSDYFSDELLQMAQQVQDTDEYVTNQDELLALAKVDFEKARPILERLVNDSNQPVSQTLARWALYLNALKEGNSIEAGNYRDALMKTVEDKNAKPGNRDLAMDAIVVGGDFAGRDEWYFSLLEDETLHDLRVGGQSYTGLTTLLSSSPPDKYVDKMIEMLKSSNPAVRSMAARNLLTVLRRNDPRFINSPVLRGEDTKIISALLPWLENPNWARQIENERSLIVSALSRIEIPESVPGLIAVLNEKATVEIEDEDEDYYPNANVMRSNSMPKGAQTREVYPYRDSAINALAIQKNFQAAAALREVLPEGQIWKRGDVVKAILVSGGFTIAEQVEALEIKAREFNIEKIEAAKIINLQNQAAVGPDEVDITELSEIREIPPPPVGNIYSGRHDRIGSTQTSETFNPADIKAMLGDQLINIGEPSNELVSAVSFRLTALEKTDPQVAEIIRSIMQNWQGAAVNALLLNYLGEGKSDLNAIVKLLSLRRELRENQVNNIYDAQSKGNPIALGISACLLENEGDYSRILANAGDDTKIALLGCARLIRAPLALQTVAGFLKNPNKTLALAAERYIESEDSPAARQIIYSLYPNEAKILGATYFFGNKEKIFVRPDFLVALFSSIDGLPELPPYYFYAATNATDVANEEKLTKEIKQDEKLLGVYAYDKNFVRIYQDKAVFSWEEDEARYFERKLSDTEFGYLKSFLASNDVNNLPPFVSNCSGCLTKQLLMLGRSGGRRIFVATHEPPQFFAGLVNIFEDMRKPPAALRYWLEKDIAGAQILFADQDLEAVTVWKNGDDLRVFINNTIREREIERELEKLSEADEENDNLDYEQAMELNQKRRMQRAFESYSWHRFAGNKLGDFANQPVGIDFITQFTNTPRHYRSESWSAKTGNVEIKTDGENLYKVVGGQTTKIQTGFYRNPVITADGRWVVLTKYSETEEAAAIVRINLQNNREFRVKNDDKKRFSKPVAYISAVNKILIETGSDIDYRNDTIKQGTYILLDPDTGTVQGAKGEFRPFIQQTFRRLQKAANADEVWAAIPDKIKKETQIGTFNEKTFVFTTVLTVPQISFDSMDMWVDEAENKVFIVYNGQLLSIPLKKETNEPPKP